MAALTQRNAEDLGKEFEWLQRLIQTRLHAYFSNETPDPETFLAGANPPVLKKGSTYADFVLSGKLGLPERAILSLALAPYLKPELPDFFLAKNTIYDKKFSEFGGMSHGGPGFVPTWETALFLLAGTDLAARFGYYPLLTKESPLVRRAVLKAEPLSRNDPFNEGRLAVGTGYAEYFVTGSFPKPDFGEEFPARLVTTRLEWDDVVLKDTVKEEVSEIIEWVEHGEALLQMEDLGKRLRPGYKSLFYGPPGTGKTLMATMIGKMAGHDVYRIDLSLIVSKFIGETEKNLSKIFDAAEHRSWVLFFDEADALFGKRTSTSSSNDRYANQEVAYLLQRIEDHPGVVILASNLKDNIDQAFMRRFQSVIHFPMPGPEERLKIWQGSFPQDLRQDKNVDLESIARKYELSGGMMMNVIRYCTLKALRDKRKTIRQEDIETGIRRELLKDGILLA